MGKWQFWVDRGGTFTDIVGAGPDGACTRTKLLSENPAHYADAAVQGIREPEGDGTTPRIESVKMGTTVATNALLERKGDRVSCSSPKGFGDLLRIGTRRARACSTCRSGAGTAPRARWRKSPERLDARGCDRAAGRGGRRSALQAPMPTGIRPSPSPSCMPTSTRSRGRAAEIAREIGFDQISTSHEASRLIKLVGRGDTAVVDAYLSPILRRYVRQVADALDLGRAAATGSISCSRTAG
jgi:5-oxoprolinase (ATP-hydrolysing)